MNIKQIQWTMDKCNALLAIPQSYPLDEETAQKVKETSEHYLKLAKGNEEFRQAILNTLIFIDDMDRLHREYKKKMEVITDG